jgi:hypothetical protein
MPRPARRAHPAALLPIMKPKASEPPGESPRSSLLARRVRHEDDEKLLEIIAGLPAASGGARHSIAGICNNYGQVYRRVELFSALELFMLIARLNAMGFVQESGVRAGKYAYDVVFHKVPKRRGTDSTPVG